MKIFADCFWMPKDGNTETEYEDAYHPKSLGEMDGTKLHFAVSDGATEGLLSGPWARMLTRLYCRIRLESGTMEGFLSRAYGAWNEYKTSYIEQRNAGDRPVQWFEEPGLSTGSFATLLGLMLAEDTKTGLREWNAIAIGDSCLFQIRGNQLTSSFPIDCSAAFSDRPLLISSNPAYNSRLAESITHSSGCFQVDDCFYLMTDALAAWALREHESGCGPWRLLNDLGTLDEVSTFRELIRELRDSNRLRNDDVTMLRISIL